MRIFTPEMDSFLKSYVADTPYRVLADMVNAEFKTSFTRQQVKDRCKLLRLKNRVDGRFLKGQIPWMKGKPSANHLPVGSETIWGGDIYRKIQEPGIWKRLNHIIWEESFGPIPEGMLMIFLDGNHMNCSLDNLMLVKRSEIRPLYYHVPELRSGNRELARTAVNYFRLRMKIRNLEKDKRYGS